VRASDLAECWVQQIYCLVDWMALHWEQKSENRSVNGWANDLVYSRVHLKGFPRARPMVDLMVYPRVGRLVHHLALCWVDRSVPWMDCGLENRSVVD
jgi:hypothetical protein